MKKLLKKQKKYKKHKKNILKKHKNIKNIKYVWSHKKCKNVKRQLNITRSIFNLEARKLECK